MTHACRSPQASGTRPLGLVLGLLSALLLLAAASPAHATHIVCGATLGPGGIHVLEADLGPCDPGAPALTVKSATLRLDGFTVSCAPSSAPTTGISLVGTGAWLTLGTVSGCGNGVVLGGAGGHTVSGVMARGNSTGDGFRVAPKSDGNALIANRALLNVNGFSVHGKNNALSWNFADANSANGFVVRPAGTKNRLNQNVSDFNGDDGFDVEGVDNLLAGNTARSNVGDGFDVAGRRNLLVGNTASGNVAGGFEAEGSDNSLFGNTAQANGEGGFELYGLRNRAAGNVATENQDVGFQIAGNRNVVNGNRANGNQGSGYRADGNANDISGNYAESNGGSGFEGHGDANGFAHNLARVNAASGIHLGLGSAKSRVAQNVSLGHAAPAGFDLAEDNPGCDTNRWQFNLFVTESQSCTR
jgi:parallel beta-helix repeat protein